MEKWEVEKLIREFREEAYCDLTSDMLWDDVLFEKWLKENLYADDKAYVTGDGDLGMDGELRPLIRNKTELIIVKLTRGGMAYLTDGKKFYSVPPRNVREII